MGRSAGEPRNGSTTGGVHDLRPAAGGECGPMVGPMADGAMHQGLSPAPTATAAPKEACGRRATPALTDVVAVNMARGRAPSEHTDAAHGRGVLPLRGPDDLSRR